MWMMKDGVLLGEKQAILPINVKRTSNKIGSSNWENDHNMIGAVLGLKVESMLEKHSLELPEITGPFTVTATARFDNTAANFQKIFDFGNGPMNDNIVLTQVGSNMRFVVWNKDQPTKLEVSNVVEQGATDTWTVGVKPDGVFFMKKNDILLKESPGILPNNVARKFKLVGESNTPDDPVLQGAVLGISVNEYGKSTADEFENKVSQIYGVVHAKALVRFDNIAGGHWQRGNTSRAYIEFC